MKTIKKILYATDFSESSVPACDYALTLAKLAGAELHVLHVIGELTEKKRARIPPEAFTVFEKGVEVNVIKEMEAFCEEKFDGEVEYVTETVIGIPFEEIIGKAEAIAADLIVLGTHGRTGLEHVIVGSTAERVVRHSSIPVLTVRLAS